MTFMLIQDNCIFSRKELEEYILILKQYIIDHNMRVIHFD